MFQILIYALIGSIAVIAVLFGLGSLVAFTLAKICFGIITLPFWYFCTLILTIFSFLSVWIWEYC